MKHRITVGSLNKKTFVVFRKVKNISTINKKFNSILLFKKQTFPIIGSLAAIHA